MTLCHSLVLRSLKIFSVSSSPIVIYICCIRTKKIYFSLEYFRMWGIFSKLPVLPLRWLLLLPFVRWQKNLRGRVGMGLKLHPRAHLYTEVMEYEQERIGGHVCQSWQCLYSQRHQHCWVAFDLFDLCRHAPVVIPPIGDVTRPHLATLC